MRKFKFLSLFALLTILITSCSSDDDGQTLVPIESEQITNLFADITGGGMGQPDEGPFTKFDFESGSITTSDTDWDIAFRSTAIIVNGGTTQGTVGEPERNGNAAAYVAEDTFANVTEVDESLFRQDSPTELAIIRASGMGWYTYTGPPPFGTNLILPTPGRVLVFRTRDGKYAKVSIDSYYRDNPPEDQLDALVNEPRYYTFDYVYQPNEGVTTFE
ncbi:HmuY family protein [Winogradskyella haliclonae]|uniref:HmuY protein n=1 Tax=Winogradskyella haliclonae TaxID=2048558 RepID=A0ABQ2BYR8_9FLAO|nr:HmuY family protein [Winogradskyella haliclonae]GGI57234.1 hypothetical protein GCM10011444_15430 [Winogradskyella haliclonae]